MCSFFFFNDTATTEIYTLSLHDALPILLKYGHYPTQNQSIIVTYQILQLIKKKIYTLSTHKVMRFKDLHPMVFLTRSEEHTSELQSRQYLVCRLLLEKKTLEPRSRDRVR